MLHAAQGLGGYDYNELMMMVEKKKKPNGLHLSKQMHIDLTSRSDDIQVNAVHQFSSPT